EALRQRRINENLGGPIQLAGELTRRVAGLVDLVAKRRACDSPHQGAGAPAGTAGQHQIRPGAALSPESLAGQHQRIDVLARLESSKVEDVWGPAGVASAYPLGFGGVGGGREVRVDPVGDDPDPWTALRVVPQKISGRGLRNADEPGRAVDGPF